MTRAAHDTTRLYRGPAGVVLEPAVRLLRGHGLARRHKLVWWAHRAVWRLTHSNRVRIDGFDLEVDLHDSLQLARGSYEPEESAWYAAHVRPGDTVLELGGNVGYFTCLFARAVGPEGLVVAYEPDPMLADINERNAASHGYADRVVVRRSAASDESGRVTFFRAGRNYGNNSLFRDDRDALGGTSFEVDVVRVDDDLADLGRPIDVVKMDIQGAESLALAGMSRILERDRPRVMVVEFWPKGLDGMGRDPRELLEVLDRAGYKYTELGSDDLVDPDDLLERLTPENAAWTNLVCTRKS